MDKVRELPRSDVAVALLDASERHAAVAWAGPGHLVIEFYDVLDTGEGLYPFVRETRILACPAGTATPPSSADLQSRLASWVANDRSAVPAIEQAPQEFAVNQFSPTDVKNAPYSQMFAELMRTLATETSATPFQAPTPEDFEDVTRLKLKLDFASTTALQSRISQLQAVEAYLTALHNDNTSPLKTVADVLGVSHIRARNLIQFARENDYLTAGRSKGKATGMATPKAYGLTRAVSAAIADAERRQAE
jgi:hypothetical protein